MITGTKMRFKEDKDFSCQSSRRLRVNPAGPPPSQLMLTEIVGRGAASKPGARHNLSGSRRGPGERHRQPGWEAGLARPPEQAEASPGPPGLQPSWETGLARPPQDPQAYGAGSGQSQAKGQMLWDLFYLQTISKMAGMFCFSKEPPGKAFTAQAECRDRYPPPPPGTPAPQAPEIQ